MNPAPTKPGKLHWLKFNPTEWLGMFPELTDEEYGLLHRVIAKLWAAPGNRMSEAELLADLRLQPASHRANVLHGLIGYALKDAGDGTLFIPALDDAFVEVARRVADAKKAAEARWPKTQAAAKSVPVVSNPDDF
jgi:hypothetical protein